MDSSKPQASLDDSAGSDRFKLGRKGEEYAAAYLRQIGYRLVASNFVLPVGRNLLGAVVTAEIDLIAYDGDILCFVEVKTRASDWFAPPQANVDRRKQRQLSRAARTYRRMFGLETLPYRYDVVSVVLPANEDPAPTIQIELLRNFWSDAKFRRKLHFTDAALHKNF